MGTARRGQGNSSAELSQVHCKGPKGSLGNRNPSSHFLSFPALWLHLCREEAGVLYPGFSKASIRTQFLSLSRKL
jgi:hypothetical protein